MALIAAGLIQLYLAARGGTSPRLFAAACLTLAAVSLEWQGTWFTAHSGLLPWHLFIAVVLAIGARPHDRLARAWQGLGAALLTLPVLVWTVIVTDPRFSPPPTPWNWAFGVYPLALALVAVGYGWLVGNRAYRRVVATDGCLWSGMAAWYGYLFAQQLLAGLRYLVGGAVCFLLAAIISLLKTGLPQRWWSNYRLRTSREL